MAQHQEFFEFNQASRAVDVSSRAADMANTVGGVASLGDCRACAPAVCCLTAGGRRAGMHVANPALLGEGWKAHV